MKKIICVLCAALFLCCTLGMSVFAVTTSENAYFDGEATELGSTTIDGSYVSFPKGVYINGSFEMPFMPYGAGTLGKTQMYEYSAVSDLILDYSDYKNGTLLFTVSFYDGDTFLNSVDIETTIDNNNTAQVTDDTYWIAAVDGAEIWDGSYQYIPVVAQPYIAFNIYAMLCKAYKSDLKPTHVQISFVEADCTADFRIYGVMNNLSITYGDVWNEGYNKGFADGKEEGYFDGYVEGHIRGKKDGAASVDQDAIFNEGFDEGFTAGVTTNEAYDVGFEDGKEWQHNYDTSVGEVSNFFYDAGGAIISAFLYIGSNVEVMGFSLLSILGLVVLGIIVYFGVKALRGS